MLEPIQEVSSSKDENDISENKAIAPSLPEFETVSSSMDVDTPELETVSSLPLEGMKTLTLKVTMNEALAIGLDVLCANADTSLRYLMIKQLREMFNCMCFGVDEGVLDSVHKAFNQAIQSIRIE